MQNLKYMYILELLALDHHVTGLEGVVSIKPAQPCNAVSRIFIWVSVVHTIKMSSEATEIKHCRKHCTCL